MTVADAINSGDITVTGERGKLEELISYLDTFEFWFNIVTP
ncbi:MAG: alkyl sulfatase C-terminal domain-containing protein [Hyphomicrobiaceae bacterium]